MKIKIFFNKKKKTNQNLIRNSHVLYMYYDSIIIIYIKSFVSKHV